MGYAILFFWLLILPVCVGGLFQYHNGFEGGLRLLKGQFLLWAVFQLITVPVILWGGTLETVMWSYLPLCFLLGLAGLVFMIRRKEKPTVSAVLHWGREEKLLLVLVLALWLFQMMVVVTQAVYDGDDSFYMAVANIANTNGSLYQSNSYS
ncbi:MAG: DUF6077 domain-containing protein, partial [Lachnospiraceae bacterium]|nr:DUF6077 domain-containing protein [Lachnospiraceae bacterium]